MSNGDIVMADSNGNENGKVDKGKGKAGDLGLADLITSGTSPAPTPPPPGRHTLITHVVAARQPAVGGKVPSRNARRRRRPQGHHLDQSVQTSLALPPESPLICGLTPLLAVDQFISKNRVPHLLFYGPPGTGKTSTILAVARKIYGTGALLRNNCLEVRSRSRRSSLPS